MCIACIFMASIFCFTIGYLLGCANTTDRFIDEQKNKPIDPSQYKVTETGQVLKCNSQQEDESTKIVYTQVFPTGNYGPSHKEL